MKSVFTVLVMGACASSFGASGTEALPNPADDTAVLSAPPLQTPSFLAPPLQTEEIIKRDSLIISERYPPGFFQSVTQADTAIREIKQQRSLIDMYHIDQEKACTLTFFTNHCLNKAKENRRAALALLRPVELEANAFKRRSKIVKRDEELAKKLPKPDPLNEKAIPDSAVQETNTAVQKNAASVKPDEARTRADIARRTKPSKERGVKMPKKSSEIDAATQQRNAEAYDKKLMDSLKRQEAVVVKKYDAQQKRLKKQANEKAGSMPSVLIPAQ